MRFKQVGNKRDDICLVVHNADTVALLPGQAAILNGLNGTNDGLDVVGPTNAATNFAAAYAWQYLYGVVISPSVGGIPAGGYGEVQAFGFCGNVQLTLATRSASSVVWPSYASIGTTLMGLYPETLANGFTTQAAQSFASVSTAASPSALTQFLPPLILGQSIASATTQASSLAGYAGATALTVSVKAFVRIL